MVYFSELQGYTLKTKRSLREEEGKKKAKRKRRDQYFEGGGAPTIVRGPDSRALLGFQINSCHTVLILL